MPETKPDQFMDKFNQAPDDIRYLATSIALQRMGYNNLIGLSFYEDCKKKYPEYFDKDGNCILNSK